MMTLVKKQWMAKRKERKGFTLLEMLLVVFIIAALLLLVLPNLINQQKSVSTKTDDAFVTAVQNQVTIYTSDKNGEIPKDFGILEKANYLSSKQAKDAAKKLHLNQETGEVTLITESSSGNEQS
ncbi:competence type IV pilus major pilin ComGC [Schleiferilactobacillus harbinensis]|jgi:competence protein ComGC|uniref:Competence type IV pilus major pilin ComGC n=1 Tax=Schleiferilactobacillus harbinensis TaxID=304207 RepID=A0A510TVJ3_9LACO|nr:competence type IV pilus major pilin ComGC [Schleiferilactobacillus harbinensis]QFR23973.1 prepilin-type N-terminal cleavage/methylation domain-containing protein [Schleiferilactobacillus harbinensis]GEK05490.1 competence protein ComGC [Schleiferilactobacillus harbinensis]